MRKMDAQNISRLTEPVNQFDHAMGPPDSPVTLVEYGDFECPFCGMAYPVVKELRQRLGDRLRFVFRHFPRPEHPHARHAAEMAEAAGAQDQFWPMHDLLFDHQQALDDGHLVQYAATLGLDLDRAERELEEHVHDRRIQADIQTGVHSGVHGTPTFFVNGLKHEGPDTFEDLFGAIMAQLGEVAPIDRAGAPNEVDEASAESFPASDAPGWISERV